MKRILAMSCVLLIVLSLAGCDLDMRNKLIGRWFGTQSSIKLEFYRDGTVEVEDNENGYSGQLKWEVNDGSLWIDGVQYECNIINTLMTIQYEGYSINFHKIMKDN